MSTFVQPIAGNLSRDPELRFSQSGTPVVNFSIAVNHRVQRDGQWVDGDPEFFDLVAFNDLATNLAESLQKGMRFVGVVTATQRRWTTEDGSKRSRVEFRVEEGGPSLKWAVAQVTKVQRANAAVPPRGDDGPVYTDEEPF